MATLVAGLKRSRVQILVREKILNAKRSMVMPAKVAECFRGSESDLSRLSLEDPGLNLACRCYMVAQLYVEICLRHTFVLMVTLVHES